MSSGFDAFHSLESEKKMRVIRAALDEFGEKGFKRASTNAIVEKAGIGKGMLFYYFGSKEELFDFVCEYTIEYMRNTYMDKFEPNTGDFVERYRRLIVLKHELMGKLPEVFKFFERFYDPENAEYFEKCKDSINDYRDSARSKLYEGIDRTLFRADIEPETVMKYITWMLNGYENELVVKVNKRECIFESYSVDNEEWDRFFAFLNDLKKVFYK